MSIQCIGSHDHQQPPVAYLVPAEAARAQRVIARNPRVTSTALITGTNDNPTALPEDGGPLSIISPRLQNTSTVNRLRNTVRSRGRHQEEIGAGNLDSSNILFRSLPSRSTDDIIFWGSDFGISVATEAISSFVERGEGTTFTVDMSFNIAYGRNTISLSSYHQLLKREVLHFVMFVPRHEDHTIYCRFWYQLFLTVPEMIDRNVWDLTFPGFTVRQFFESSNIQGQ